jgi:THAP4-like, heme-binding beta-barrel domain
MPELHPDVQRLTFLLGMWRGRGHGEYPTIESFDYEEEIAFFHVGDAFLVYEQRSWAPESDAALHLERGFLRFGDDGGLEITLAHPLGLVEVAHGRLIDTTIEASTDGGLIGRTRTGMDVTGVRRRYEAQGDRLRYRIDMATERTAMTLHLESELTLSAPVKGYAGASGEAAPVG